MAIRLVGELLSPVSCPMASVTITLEALSTSADVLLSSSASTVTDYKGRYDFQVPTGTYSVTLEHDATSKQEIGQIQVFSDSTESTLQALLDAPTVEPAPTWWQQIEEALAESKIHADAAAQSAADALASSKGVEAFADAAKQHADRAANSASNSAKSATAAEASAVRAEGILDLAESAAEKLPEIIAEGDRQVARVKAEGDKFIAQTTMIVTDATEQAERAKVEADRAKSEADRAAEIVGLDNVDAAVADALSRAHMYAMTKAEFDALREKRKSDNAGSGFLEFGKTHPIGGHYWKVNGGLWSGINAAFVNAILLGDDLTDAVGDSKTAYPVALVDGVQIALNSQPPNHGFVQATLPPAPNGTKTYDSATGVVVDYSKDVDPKYGDVAADHNEAICRAWDGLAFNGDYRHGTDHWTIDDDRGSFTVSAGIATLTDTTGQDSTGAPMYMSNSKMEILSGVSYDVSVVCTDVGDNGAVLRIGNYNDPNRRYEILKIGVNKFTFTPSVDSSGTAFLVYAIKNNTIKVSDFSVTASTTKVITSRQDLVFLESWHQDTENGVLLPFGNAQFGANSWEGIPLKKLTDLGVKQGHSAFGEWDDQTIGYGAKISDLTDEQLQKFISEPSNNIYYDSEAKKLIQVRLRVRVVEGLGDNWLNLAVTESSPSAIMYAEQCRLIVQGASDTPLPLMIGNPDGYIANGHKAAAAKSVGAWTVSESLAAEKAYQGKCFALPICLVQRLNQGAYHPVYNIHGCCEVIAVDNSSSPKWYAENAKQITSTKDAFNFWHPTDNPDGICAHINTGKIADNVTGRPDTTMKFYDAVYSSQVIDLRLSARKQEVNLLRENAIRQAVKGEMRGRGKVPFTTFKLIASVTKDEDMAFEGNSSYVGSGWRGVFRCTGTSNVNGINVYANGYIKPEGAWVVAVGSNGKFFLLANAIHYCWDAGSYKVSYVTPWVEDDIISPAPTVARNDAISEFNATFPNGTVIDYYEVDVTWLTSEFDTIPWVDLVGSPSNIAATFPNGVAGMWIGQLPNGTAQEWHFNKKISSAGIQIVYTLDQGGSWATGNLTHDAVKNSASMTINADIVQLNFYETPSSFTQAADNSVVVGSVGDVFTTIDCNIANGNRLMPSLAGNVGTNSHGNNRFTFLASLVTGRINNGHLDASINTAPRHFNNPLVPTSSGNKGVKAMSTITERDGLLYLQLHGNELIHNGTSWGDDSTVPIISGEGTKEDTNGNVVKTFCHHSMLPLGIADSSSSAISMKGLDKSGINDGLNLGLHFTTLDDVPDAIKEFYYQEDFVLEEKYREEVRVDEVSGEEYVVQVPDHIMGVRVIKYPHPHESGGHISDESIAAWEYHDQYKDWLTQCLEIQFQNSLPPELDDEGNEIPVVELPFPSEPVREVTE